MTRWHGYLREAAGPGWALVGDAGHFKDPTPGQGIADAIRQGQHLAAAIEAGLGAGDLDGRLRDWWKWRDDDDAWDMDWFAHDMGSPSPTSPLAREVLRGLTHEPGGAELFMRVINHDLRPSEVFTRRRGLAALARSPPPVPAASPPSSGRPAPDHG